MSFFTFQPSTTQIPDEPFFGGGLVLQARKCAGLVAQESSARSCLRGRPPLPVLMPAALRVFDKRLLLIP